MQTFKIHLYILTLSVALLLPMFSASFSLAQGRDETTRESKLDLSYVPKSNKTPEERAADKEKWLKEAREWQRRENIESFFWFLFGAAAIVAYAFSMRRFLRWFKSRAVPLGSRRLSIVVTPLALVAVAAMFITSGDFRPRHLPGLLFALALLAVPSLAAIPLALRVYAWVRQGFIQDRQP